MMHSSRRSAFPALLAVVCLTAHQGADAAPNVTTTVPQWRILKPSNTGIPGVLVDIVRLAPDGRLWVAAHESWRMDGGIGVLDLATGVWTTYSNWDSPLPSNFVND